MDKQFTDIEKQQLLTILHAHKVCAPGLDRLALRIAESIFSTDERSLALLTVSYYLAACESFALADEVAHRLQGYTRAAAFASIGAAIANKNPNQAGAYLKEAEVFLSQTRNVDDRAVVLQRISQGYSQLKNWQKAKELANQISYLGDRVSALCDVAGCQLKSDLGVATQTVEEARAVADTTRLSERTGALNDVAKVLVEMGRRKEALAVWEEAVVFADHAEDGSKWLFLICEKLVSIDSRQKAREVALRINNNARRKMALDLIDRA